MSFFRLNSFWFMHWFYFFDHFIKNLEGKFFEKVLFFFPRAVNLRWPCRSFLIKENLSNLLDQNFFYVFGVSEHDSDIIFWIWIQIFTQLPDKGPFLYFWCKNWYILKKHLKGHNLLQYINILVKVCLYRLISF